MAVKHINKRQQALKHLEAALRQFDRATSTLNFLTVTKAFEVLIEYEWRELKALVEDQGLDAPSPKMALKQAARLKLVTDLESWLDCIDARNNSVHDYFGISEQEYVELARKLVQLARARNSTA
ncbi:MAG: nucleotidyltransferase substrate binding protein [Deltaproteobacteria bacterium]|nr:nucleotidyltransferase substrate binding protein [Deltaproteobacteria bacterium]